MEQLLREFQELTGISLKSQQLEAFRCYQDELSLWNERYNLTAIQEPEKIRIKHFLDSLSAYLAMHGSPMERVIDVGTGAGFPGLPLKILCPTIQLSLVESIEKKAEFCRHIVNLLELDHVDVIHTRAEKLGQIQEHREMYDWALARAVAVLPVLLEYLLPLVKVGGKVLAMKGENAPAETQSAQRSMQLLGGHFHKLLPVTLPGVVEDRYLVVVNKIAATPGKYPRREGIPTKRPL